MCEKKRVNFETGNIDPRNGNFDHHSAVEHKDAFIVKMASVQLIEWLVMTGQNMEEIEIDLNHTGHLDDMVAHAIQPAITAGKLRSLYAFASTISVLDSCGPSGYALIQKPAQDVVNNIYGHYHKILGEIAEKERCSKFELSLDRRIEASQAAGKMLIDLLEVDNYEEATPWQPEEGTFQIISDEEVILVQGLDESFNPLRASSWFYSQGKKAVVGFRTREDGKYDYDVCVRSNYDADLTPIWPKLAEEETQVPAGERNWGGHAGAGGSPRRNDKTGFAGGSERKPDEVHTLVKGCVA